MQRDMDLTSNNPFSEGHRAAARKADADAAQKAQDVHEAFVKSVTDQGNKLKPEKPPVKAYVPAGPWWGTKNG